MTITIDGITYPICSKCNELIDGSSQYTPDGLICGYCLEDAEVEE